MLLISKCNLDNALFSASHFKASGGGRHGMNANANPLRIKDEWDILIFPTQNWLKKWLCCINNV